MVRDKRKRQRALTIALATYYKDQWQRLKEVSADRCDLEDTWEEWQAFKEEEVARLRSAGLEVYEVLVDVDALEEFCRQRGIAINSEARAAYAAYRMKMELGESY